MSKPYKAGKSHEGNFRVLGAGRELSYYAVTSWPDLSFSSLIEAKTAAKIANIAYEEGYKKAQQDMRKSLGVK